MVLMCLAAPKRRQVCILPYQSLTSRPGMQTITSADYFGAGVDSGVLTKPIFDRPAREASAMTLASTS